MKSGLCQLVAAHLYKERISGKIIFIRYSVSECSRNVKLSFTSLQNPEQKAVLNIKEFVIIVVEVFFFFFIVAPGIWELKNILLPKKTEGKLELICFYNDNPCDI